MTAPPAVLCGYRWPPAALWDVQHEHECVEPATHDDPCPCPVGTCIVHCASPPVHRCRCGATTTREDDRDA